MAHVSIFWEIQPLGYPATWSSLWSAAVPPYPSRFPLCSVDHPARLRKSSLNLFSEWCPFMSCSWLGKVWNWTCHNVYVAERLFVLLCVPLTFALKSKHTGKRDRKCLSLRASESMCGSYRKVLSLKRVSPMFSVFDGHSHKRLSHTHFSFTYGRPPPRPPVLDTVNCGAKTPWTDKIECWNRSGLIKQPLIGLQPYLHGFHPWWVEGTFVPFGHKVPKAEMTALHLWAL